MGWFSDCLPSRLHLNVYNQNSNSPVSKEERTSLKESVPDSKESTLSVETAFDFQTYCLFCGKRCQEKDPKHPYCWWKYYIVRFMYTAGWIPFNIVTRNR